MTSNSVTDAYGGQAIRSTRINGNAWRGDSGGPQFYNGQQVGVASTADGSSIQNYGSVAYNRAWITSDGRCLTVSAPRGADGPAACRPSAPRRFAASDQVNNAHDRRRATPDSIGNVLVVTTEQLPGYEIRQILGEVVSSMARTRNPYREGVKNLRGGAYDPMAPDNLTRWRTDSVARLGEEARGSARTR